MKVDNLGLFKERGDRAMTRRKKQECKGIGVFAINSDYLIKKFKFEISKVNHQVAKIQGQNI